MKTLRRILIGLAITLVLFVGVSLAVIRYVGAWNLVFPNRDHDVTAPALPASLTEPAVLVFTKTNAFRHKEAIEAGVERLEAIAAQRGFGFFHTENGAVFAAESLARFDVVVFHNASGDMLSEPQEAAFQTWLEAGGGWIGIHAAGDGSHEEWDWYHDTLIGGDYDAHIMGPQFQEARVVVEDTSHPAARNLPAEFVHTEEWYSWKSSARTHGLHVIARVDEESYDPTLRFMGEERSLAMGDHPVVWSTCVGSGRALYSALGHRADAYASPDHIALLEGALDWAAGRTGDACREAPLSSSE